MAICLDAGVKIIRTKASAITFFLIRPTNLAFTTSMNEFTFFFFGKLNLMATAREQRPLPLSFLRVKESELFCRFGPPVQRDLLAWLQLSTDLMLISCECNTDERVLEASTRPVHLAQLVWKDSKFQNELWSYFGANHTCRSSTCWFNVIF